MKKLNSKSLMVLTILVASTIAMPAMASGYNTDNSIELNQFGGANPLELIGGFRQLFPSMFGGMGYAGQMMGAVMQIIFMELLNGTISDYEMLDHVFVYNASTEYTNSFQQTYNSEEQYFLPKDYDIPTKYSDDGYAYCNVTRSGTVEVNVTIGAGVVFIIWDHDDTFIDALQRLINFFQKFMKKMQEGEPTEAEMNDLIKEGVSLISWFLIHLNDIFTGDELFVLNPISYQDIVLTPQGGNITVKKQWKMTGSNYRLGDGDDFPIEQAIISNWSKIATEKGDSQMEWLTSNNYAEISNQLHWSSFTFDVFQLWMKKFKINIDLGELDLSGEANPEDFAKVFKGMDVEFFLFTHSLVGSFLYNDTDFNDVLSVDYVNVTKDDGSVFEINGEPVQVPRDNELTHRLYLQSVGNFNYIEPTADIQKNEISWGINMTNVVMHTVPIGVDLESVNQSNPENLKNIYLGFTFSPKLSELIESEEGKPFRVASAPIKLDQHFGEWNDGSGPNNPRINGLDLAVIYVSTVLHFDLGAKLEERTEEYIGKDKESYHKERKAYVGNYITSDIGSKLEFVDIAGPGYYLGDETTFRNATTNIIPLGLWQAEERRQDTFRPESSEGTQVYVGELRISANFSVLAYAVCYPDFDGTGKRIVHDPTFNVFMIFPSESFWAVILLVGGIAIIGIATVLITRKKDGKAPFSSR